jgi:hypothetical protein
VNDPSAIIRFDGNGRAYRPGETLSGEFWLAGIDAEQVKAVEASVLWYTEGKGDEDLHVHEFRRFEADRGEPFDPLRPQRFAAMLPNSPMSYDGRIVKIRWCVRVRAFLAKGREVFGQKGFRLGSVPPARAETDEAKPPRDPKETALR